MAFQDIRKSRKFLSAADIAFILGALILIGTLLILNIYLARTLTGGEWLFLRWSGVRAFLFEHIEPYGSTIAQRVQALVYGREAFLNEYPFALNDPFYIVLLYAPLAFFSDFAIVRGIWMLLSQAALLVIVTLSVNLSEWEPPRWLFGILLGLGLFSYYSINSLLSSSPTIFLILIYLLILVMLHSFSNELAGVFLLLVAYQWEVGALFILFILVLVLAHRRWGVLAGFGMALILLLLISLITHSGWILPYLSAVYFDWYRGADYTFGLTLASIFPNFNLSINGWISTAGGVILLFEALRSVNEHSRHLIWVAFLSLALNPLMGVPMFPSNHVVLIPAAILVTALVWERWANKQIVRSAFLIGLILFFYFGFYFEMTVGLTHVYSEVLRILPPVLTVLGLYWMRWWAIRPPRIWADQLGERK